MLSANEMRHEREMKDKLKYDLFKRILQQCHDAVRQKNQSCSEMWLFYEIPTIVVGEPLYNSKECGEYIQEMLKDCGFWVKMCKPGNVIFISWHPEHCRTPPMKRTSFLANALHAPPERKSKEGKEPIVEDLRSPQ